MAELLTPIRLLVNRLSGSIPLEPDDTDALEALLQRPRAFARGQVVVDQGAVSDTIWLMVEGWAFRQRALCDGRRQIIAIMLPGELSEKGPAMPFGSPEAIVAATPMVAHAISRSSLMATARQHPRILEALLFEEVRRHAISREWLLLLGQKRADERLAYLIYETFVRLRAIGLLKDEKAFDFPVTQQELGDIVGISAVHLNRMLQLLRSRHLVTWHGSVVELLDVEALAQLAQFGEGFETMSREYAERAAATGSRANVHSPA